MADMRKLRSDEPTYYRGRADARVPALARPETPGPEGPIPDGVIWGEANAATVGPLRAPFSRDVVEVTVPCAISPLGVNNQAVLLIKNDFQSPMYTRLRLARNGVEGRLLISRVNAVKGGGGQQPAEWVNLVTQPQQMFEALLLNGEALYGIGSWPGIVPLVIGVTVTAWNP
jgi:hypothetical protein